jgi:hypothetical protein
MSDLILSFPSAAAGGVQWQTLIRKYNERHSASLGAAPFGHSSALSAATALLWEELRLVDSEDTDNPVVAVEDHMALTAKPGAPATWPSMYKSLCEIVNEHGTQEEISGDDSSRAILVSQLKPHLLRHWHSAFDECSFSYLTEEGTPVRVKKMKHLLQALPRWREQRVASKAGVKAKTSQLDIALEPVLELVPSKKHNDLLLRCVQFRPAAAPMYRPSLLECHQENAQDQSPPQSTSSECDDVESITDSSSSAPAELKQEIAMLRAENARLRGKKCVLEHQCQDDVLRKALFDAEQMADVFDNPSEPPPCAYWGNPVSPSGSTAVPSDFGFSSGCATPRSAASGSHPNSGAATPTAFAMAGQVPQVCTMIPMWFAMGDRAGIPCGVVQQARSIFECHKNLPSQLLHPVMSCPGDVRMC